MSSDTDTPDYSPGELRQMDDDEARRRLTVEEFERREKLIELHEQADEQRQEWADEDDRVEEITVHADRNELGTEVDLFGNDVLVHIDSDDRDVRNVAERLDAKFGDADADEIDDLDAADRDEIADGLKTLLDAALVEWNGTDWDALDAAMRADVLEDARDKWGVDGLLIAWVDVATAIRDDREERLDVVQSFQ